MTIDSGLLEQAKTAEGRLIDAEHAAEVARADFHQAVRRLQLAGGSLREIADALNLSHQRIHQIVESAGGSRRWRRDPRRPPIRCSFCGKDQHQVQKVIAGPGIGICDECVARADTAINTGTEVSTPEATLRLAGGGAGAERCGFCGKRGYQVTAMACADDKRICTECLSLCHEIIDDDLT
jgi:hypothetical protein